MRYVDKDYNTIPEAAVDLTAGHLEKATLIREDATPIDNITKWAWADDDYEEVQVYVVDPVAQEVDTISTEDTILDMMADHEYRLCLLELGGDI